VTQEPNQPRPDPVGDFQRWLFRSGARGVSRELGGNIRAALGLNGAKRDVWESATADPAPEAPECAWCPVCRAARMLRESRPGVGAYLAAAGETVASLAHEVASAVEAAISAAGKPQPSRGPRAGEAPRAGEGVRPDAREHGPDAAEPSQGDGSGPPQPPGDSPAAP